MPMFESFLAVPLHFTVEFLGFLVFAGSAVLILARPDTLDIGRVGRSMTATGFAVAAGANVVHGASFQFALNDGDEVLVVARAVGFLLIAGGLAVPAKDAMVLPAIGGFKIREPLLFLPAATALLAGFSAWKRAQRMPGSYLGAVAVGTVLLALAEGLTSVAPRADISSGVVGTYSYIAHGAKLLGFISLGVWVGKGARNSIRTRLVVSFAALLIIVVLALSTALTGVISNNVGEEQLRAVESQLETAVQNIESDRRDLLDETGQIAALSEVGRSVEAGQGVGDLVEGIKNDLEFFEVDFVAVLDANGRQLAFSHEGPQLLNPAGRAESKRLNEVDVLSLLGSPVVGELRDGGTGSSSIDVISEASIVAEMAGVEIDSPTGDSRAGYLITARWIDQLSVEAIADSFAPSHATLMVDDQVLASTLRSGVTGEELMSEDVRRELVLGGRESLQQTIGGDTFFGSVASLPNALGNPTAATLSLSTPSSIVASTREDVIRVLFLVALGITFIVLVLAWLSGRRLTRPIRHLTHAAVAVSKGNLDATAPVSGDDEVGRLGDTFNQMTSAIRRMTGDLRTAAHEEHQLRERIEKIIQSMADALIAVDGEARIVAFNAEAEVMVGRDAATVMGHPIAEVMRVIDSQGEEVHLPVYDLGEGTVGGVFLERRRRSPIPVAVTSAVLRREDGAVAGGVAVLRDMTQAREVERMKSEFLSNISHELRTPLTPIKGYAEMLAKKDIPLDKQRVFAHGILDSTLRLERIVGLLVDFTALEAGRLAPRARLVDMGSVLQRLSAEWSNRVSRHQVVAEIEPGLDKIMGDERLLRRSIEEVIDNAVKFSPNGGEIRLVARNQRVNGVSGPDRIEVSITDQGIGIDPDDAARVFSDFQQVDASTTRTYGGLGLGLAFVRRIVEAHDGSVEVDQDCTIGTRLIVRIPSADS
jgi:two-component system, OmpR family, sensor histidine kinase VicK